MRIADVAVLLALAGCAKASPAAVPDAVQQYRSFGQFDDASRWAPMDCEAPPPHLSRSRDAETHGRKLYHLFAKDREAYRRCKELPQPVGQVLVKESWLPAPTSTFQNPVKGDRGPLFLMIKTGEADSDDGWIYATATPDGKTITSWGKLASCMECHQEAKHDRLFGVTSCAAAK